MKQIFVFLLSIIILTCQCNAKEKISKEVIRKELDKVFRVDIFEHDNQKSAFIFVDTLEANHFLYSFVKENNLMLDYLLQNQLKINHDSLNCLINDAERLKNYFKNLLYSDSAFIDNFLVLAANYLNNDNSKNENNIFKTDSIEISDIAQLAVRFYYPIAITEDNKVRTKICVGIHGLTDYGGERNYLKEAFAFSVIFGQINANNLEIYNEYYRILDFVKKMNLSNDRETKLKRIQGAVWAVLSQSEQLRKAIYLEYENRKAYLPFSIK